MKVTDIRDALLALTDKVYHYTAPARDCANRYIVWGETGCSVPLDADDRPDLVTVTGELILYTQTEYDPMLNRLTAALAGLAESDGFAWQGAGMGYDEQGHFFQYVFAWSACCGIGEIY